MEIRESKELAVIDRLKKKYGVTRQYVVMSINGTRTGDVPLLIKNDYQVLIKKVEEVLK